MKSNNTIKIRTCDLPMMLEVEGPNGAIKLLELLPSKDGFGVFINKTSKAILKYFGKNK